VLAGFAKRCAADLGAMLSSPTQMTYLKAVLAGIAMGIGALAFVVCLTVGYVFIRVELAARFGIAGSGGMFGSVPLVPVAGLALLLFGVAFWRGFRLVVKRPPTVG
jgi:hypothetical protein